jgi:hypothetical protein
MKRQEAEEYISYAVNDAMSERDPSEAPTNARLVGWQCGFEPMFVAVWSYLPNTQLDDEEAEVLATNLLQEKKWFADNDSPPRPDYIL